MNELIEQMLSQVSEPFQGLAENFKLLAKGCPNEILEVYAKQNTMSAELVVSTIKACCVSLLATACKEELANRK
jgi:hypothetical protein